MFTTVDEVEEMTGFTVTQPTIIIAQGIIESYVGRLEVDVTKAQDSILLGRAVAYQAAYMHDGGLTRTFEQMKAQQILEYGNMVSFFDDGYSPWIAPLAVLACKHLSWKRMRSIKTGSIFNQPVAPSRWATE